MNKNFISRAFIAASALLLIDWGFAIIQGNNNNISNAAWDLLANFLMALVIIVVADYNLHIGKFRALILWLIAFTIGGLNILIEAWIFNVTDLNQTLFSLFHAFIKFGSLALLITFLVKARSDIKSVEYEKRSFIGWTWRILISVVFYLFIYVAAGMILQATLPAINEFYTGKLPEISTLINTQFLRGFIFVGIAILFTHTSTLPRTKKVILLGLIFSVLGGIAPLLPPNNLMPAIIRLGHGFEVGISNFLYGWVIGLVLAQKTK